MQNWTDPAAIIGMLIRSVRALGPPSGPLSYRQVQAFARKLDRAKGLLERGEGGEAMAGLQDYWQQVMNLVDENTLTDVQGQALTGPLEAVLQVLGGREIDGYRLQAELGRGGVGTVFKALDVELDRVVAIKILSPSLANEAGFLHRFKAGARALALIDSPYIVRIIRLRTTDIGLFIVMEYVDGGTLADWILERGVISWKQALPLVEQMLQALCDAHAVGVVHRDLKPRNIMLSRDGEVKITDFDLATVLQRGADSTVAQWESTVTQWGGGTLYYMSPEQVKGLRHADHRSDLYSMGITIYEMLTGRLPFNRDDSMFTIMKMIVEEDPPSPSLFTPDLPEALVDIVRKALKKDPDDRYQSAEEMLEAVRHFQKLSPVPEKPPKPEPERQRWLAQWQRLRQWHLPRLKLPRLALPRLKLPALTLPRLKLPGLTLPKATWGRYLLPVAAVLMLAIILIIWLRGSGIVPPDEPVARPGMLAVTSAPPGALVRLNGEGQGTTPTTFEGPAGTYTLELELDGFRPYKNSVTLGEARADTINVLLEPLPSERGMLVITSDPAEAKILLDTLDTGLVTRDTLRDLAVGTYKVRLEKQGYHPYDTTVVVSSPQTNLDVKLSPSYGRVRLSVTQTSGLTITNEVSGEMVVSGRMISPTNPYAGWLRAVPHTVRVSPTGGMAPQEVSIMIVPDSTVYQRFTFN